MEPECEQSPVSLEKERKRKRKRVSKACDSCRKAKTSCSDYRPCARCLRLDIADTCNDFEHSKAQATDKSIWKRLLSSIQDNPNSEQLENTISSLMSPTAVLDLPFQHRRASNDAGGGSESEMALLRRENNALTQQLLNALQKVHQLSTEKHSFYYFSLMSNPGQMATSVWGFPNTVLLDCNPEFSKLSGGMARPNEQFSCKLLFREYHVQRCVRIISFLSTRTVYSLIVPQKWVVNEKEVDVLSMVRLVFDEAGCPIQIIMLSSEGTPAPDEELFVPKQIKFMPGVQPSDHTSWSYTNQSTTPENSNSYSSPCSSSPSDSHSSVDQFTSLLEIPRAERPQVSYDQSNRPEQIQSQPSIEQYFDQFDFSNAKTQAFSQLLPPGLHFSDLQPTQHTSANSGFAFSDFSSF